MRIIYLICTGIYAGLTTYALFTGVLKLSFEYLVYAAVLFGFQRFMSRWYHEAEAKRQMLKMFSEVIGKEKNEGE